ncbi:GntR family transcriptional regulator [Pantoea sp. 18069]|uniref:GntR family transcriptional regulator n=1 Tax=Pantoea sp. 18069 TaxID=2681415 RepID=UPI00190F9267|nr:GntR family transcriptional regulator [Pantoea sp. 18069]
MTTETIHHAPEDAQDVRPQTVASAADEVFFGIFNGLEVQRFVPGQRLVEADLAIQFGVGRNSVREAMQRLAANGIVDVLRHKGATIKSLTIQETMHVLDVAERMTGLLARTAAQGVRAGHSPQPIQAGLQRLIAAEKEQDADAFARARRNFYRALLDAAGSRELRRLFPSIQMPIVYAQHRLPALQKIRLADYRAISKAVIGGDEAGADAAGMAHVRNVRDEITRKQAQADAGRA